MADDDDYQILPQKDFYSLKKKVDEMGGAGSSKKLLETMDELKKILNELIELFKATSQEIKQEEKDDIDIKKKLDKVLVQNKVMADALLAISEKVGMHHEIPEKEVPIQPPLRQENIQQVSLPQYPPMQMGSPFQNQGMSPGMNQPPMGMPSSFGNLPPEPFTPRPYGGIGQVDPRNQPFGMGGRQQAPFEPPEFASFSGQGMNLPQSNPSFSNSNPPPGPGSDFPDIGDFTGDKDSKKKKGFFGFGK